MRQQFQQIVDRHYNGLWRYVCAIARGAAESEDILHQAFLLAFDKLAAGEEFTGDVGAWLRGVARNLVHAWWRQQRKLPQDVADRLNQLADKADDALTAAAAGELNAALDHCLGKLPAPDRQLIGQHYEHGRRIAAIAEEQQQNAATVRVRLFRIRQALKQCIEKWLARGITA